jgi:Cu2+-exporting ATPase
MRHNAGEIHDSSKRMSSHDKHGNHHERMVADFKKRFWVSLLVTVPILILSPLIQELLGITEAIDFPGDLYILWGLSSFIFFYGGYPFLKGIIDELKAKNPGMMTLIALAIVTAYTYSSAVVFGLSGKVFFWELASLIDIMLLGHWIEMRSIMGASKALEELARLMPSDAHKLMPDGSMEDVPLEDLVKGDKIVVKPGEKIPADGEVIKGETSVNEAMLTGESKPIPKHASTKVIGGSINGEGSISVEVQKTGSDSYLSQVIELVRQAQESKSRTQDLASRAARWLTIIGISSGVTTIIVWLVIINQEAVFALERMVTVLVITCPHALGLAVPLVVAVSTAISARNGLLIRNRAAFERARNIQAIMFDKTGTLTLGKFGTTDIVSLDKDTNKEELLKYAASVEVYSEHPIAQGIISSSEDIYSAENFKAIPGKGARAKVNGKEIMIVSPGYLSEERITIDDKRIKELEEQGKTIVMRSSPR